MRKAFWRLGLLLGAVWLIWYVILGHQALKL